MTDPSVVPLLFGLFFGLLLIGTPITVALGVASVAAMWLLDQDPIKVVQIAFNSVGSFPLMALPAFILAGALMEAAGISRRLVHIAETLAGSVTGGLAAATVIACLFFGAISGSGPATTAAVGMLMIPAMVRRGYAKSYASAVTASSGGLGIIVPPSIPMVIFGISALGTVVPAEAIREFGEFQTVSIPKLFIAGFVPGLIMSVALITMNYIQCRRFGYGGAMESWHWPALRRALWAGKWSVAAPVIILGGIYTGLFTPTESAVVAIVYTLFVGRFLYGELRWPNILKALETTTWLSGRVLLILFTATVFGRLLVENRIPAVIADAMLGMTENTYLIWLLIIACLLFVGMFMETLAAIMILTPVLLPVSYTLGIDPVHFGVVLVCTLSVGFSTPPLGENLFVASGISNVSMERVAYRALPFAAVSTTAIILIAYFPELSLALPRWLGF